MAERIRAQKILRHPVATVLILKLVTFKSIQPSSLRALCDISRPEILPWYVGAHRNERSSPLIAYRRNPELTLKFSLTVSG